MYLKWADLKRNGEMQIIMSDFRKNRQIKILITRPHYLKQLGQMLSKKCV